MITSTPLDPAQEARPWFEVDLDYFRNNRTDVCANQRELIDNRDPARPLRTVSDSISTIATKHFLLLIALPFYAFSVAVTHVIRCFTLIGVNLWKGRIGESFLSLIQEVWAVAKVPIYSCALWLSAAYGVVASRLSIRSAFAAGERAWSGSERFHSVQRLEDPSAAIKEYFTERSSKKTFFLAFCFQPIGELNDPMRVKEYRVLSLVP